MTIVAVVFLSACTKWTNISPSRIASDSITDGPVRVVTLNGDTIHLLNAQILHDTLAGPLVVSGDSISQKRAAIPISAIKTIERQRGIGASGFAVYRKYLDIVALALVIPAIIYLSR